MLDFCTAQSLYLKKNLSLKIPYLNYANIAWENTYRTKLKTIFFHQKHTVHIAINEDKVTYHRPLRRLSKKPLPTSDICTNLTRIKRQ